MQIIEQIQLITKTLKNVTKKHGDKKQYPILADGPIEQLRDLIDQLEEKIFKKGEKDDAKTN